MKTPNEYKQILNILQTLCKKYPTDNIGRHLSIALDGYDLWFISNKEMIFVLTKYAAELEYDIPHDDIDLIIKGGMNLQALLNDDIDGND